MYEVVAIIGVVLVLATAAVFVGCVAVAVRRQQRTTAAEMARLGRRFERLADQLSDPGRRRWATGDPRTSPGGATS